MVVIIVEITDIVICLLGSGSLMCRQIGELHYYSPMDLGPQCVCTGHWAFLGLGTRNTPRNHTRLSPVSGFTLLRPCSSTENWIVFSCRENQHFRSREPVRSSHGTGTRGPSMDGSSDFLGLKSSSRPQPTAQLKSEMVSGSSFALQTRVQFSTRN